MGGSGGGWDRGGGSGWGGQGGCERRIEFLGKFHKKKFGGSGGEGVRWGSGWWGSGWWGVRVGVNVGGRG